MPSLAVWAAVAAARAAAPDDPVAPWRAGVRIGPVSPGAQGHTIHSYFNTCPESPDGRLIVTDTTMDPFGGTNAQWGVVVAEGTASEK